MLNLFVGLDIYTGLLLLLALAFVLFYEAINGFHDTANAVATVIYTRAMQPQLAVVMAAFFNDKKSVISCVSDNKHSFKTFRNNQSTGIPLVNIFTYEMNKYWNI